MRRTKNTSILSATVISIGKLLWEFIKGAYLRGRFIEFLISSAILGVSFFYFYEFGVQVIPYVFVLLVYIAYWIYLFSVEKITTNKANPNWADREWWWKLDGWEFEEEAAKIFRLNGYKAQVTKKTGDGGIDIILKKDKKKIIVQCKHYRSAIAPEVLRALWGVREDFRTEHVMLLASSGISKASRDFIKNKPTFKIMDLEDLIRIGLRPT